jgi:hypothetical protein
MYQIGMLIRTGNLSESGLAVFLLCKWTGILRFPTVYRIGMQFRTTKLSESGLAIFVFCKWTGISKS